MTRHASNTRIAGACICLSIIAAPLPASEVRGTVVSVADGDTFTLQRGKKRMSIRVYGIDCPEKDQAFGAQARHFTNSMIFGRQVTVIPIEKDRGGRLVAHVQVRGKSLNRELVKNGMAWWYRRYAPDDDSLRADEAKAKSARIGLWVQDDPIAPWVFRRK